MRTETLAIVFTDIKGYTAATSKQSHQEQARMLRRIDRLVAPVVRAYSGRVIKSLGDAYMIVFRSPTEAVRCATAIQDRLYQHNAGVPPEHGIHIRIAINVGEVRVHRGDVFGEPVNIAARMETVTPADDIFFSAAVYLTMNRSDIPSDLVGDYELKGIPEPVTVYRARKAVGSESSEEEAGKPTTGLPYGGRELTNWRRARALRYAYHLLWALAVVGLAGTGYLRYRPPADYGGLLARMKAALDEERPIDALALGGQIPDQALHEWQQARRLRKLAVRQLVAAHDVTTARAELERLVAEDARDAEALVLRSVVLAQNDRPAALRAAMQGVQEALALDPALVDRQELADAVARGYAEPVARKLADDLVEKHLKDRAIPSLKRALADGIGDRAARSALATRLEKLGAAQEVDWVALAIEDLKATSCQTRKTAIGRLLKEGDERAVGPLMKLAEAKTCGSSTAAAALEAILK